jgi:zinc transporter, ZIP family
MKKVAVAFVLVLLFIGAGILFWQSQGDATAAISPAVKYATWAFLIGAITTISLPIGAITGLTLKPGARITSILTAFGAGALLAALSIELIAPTVMDIVSQSGVAHTAKHKEHAIYNMGALLLGCLAGGFLFYSLDELINSKGGIIRRVSYYVLQRNKIKSVNESNVHNENTGGAPMAIWLGLLIDGIPESFVIGAGFLAMLEAKQAAGIDHPDFSALLPYTLIAGLFLSNFPEALAASIGMKKGGMGTRRILLLWMSLVLIISVGALFGYYIGASIPHEIEIGIEGLAAGAMLTMIGQTMLPEAVHLGGTKLVGLSTLAGYLSAVAFKIFE